MTIIILHGIPGTVLARLAVAKIAHVTIVPIVVVVIDTTQHVVLVSDTRSTALLEIFCCRTNRITSVVSHSFVGDEPGHGYDPAGSLTNASVTAVTTLQIDQLAAVVPYLDHGHGVVVGGPEVVGLRHDGDQAVVLAGPEDVPSLQHGDVRPLLVDHPHALPVREGRLVG